MSEVKEPHHFSWEDDGWPRWAVREREAYEALFDGAEPEQQRGESSTWTLYSERAPSRIAQTLPDARFVILLRNPPDRAFSNWAFNFGRGYDSINTFEAALAAESSRVAKKGPWHHHYVRAGLYHDQLVRYINHFSRDQMLVLLFEDLRADAVSVVECVYDFLGVDSSFRPNVVVAHNSTYVPRSRQLHNFLWRSNPVKLALKRALPFGLSTFFGKRLRQRNRKAPPSLSPETRSCLNEIYRIDVAKLSELIGRDLSTVWLKESSR